MSNQAQITIAQAGDIVEGFERLPLGREVILLSHDDLGQPIKGVNMVAIARDTSQGEMLDLTTMVSLAEPHDSLSRSLHVLGASLQGDHQIDYDVPISGIGSGILIFDQASYLPERIGGSVTPAVGGKLWIVHSTIVDYQRQLYEDLGRSEALWTQHLKVVQGLIEVLSTSSLVLHEDIYIPDKRLLYIEMPGTLELPETAEPEKVEKRDPFEGFAGIEGIVDELRDMVKLANLSPERRKQLGVEIIQAALLYGPSGVAKTQLMFALGEALEAEIMDIDFSEITGTHVGEWARNLESMFKLAFSNPNRTLIVLDEMDGLVKSGNHDVTANITAVLKKQLERIKQFPHVFVVGATNNIDAIDPVVRAHKRIPLQLPISLPGTQEREAIFRKLLVANRVSSTDHDDLLRIMELADTYDFEALAAATEEFSGGEIQEVLKAVARQKALSSSTLQAEAPISQNDILAAIRRARITKSY